MEVALAAKTNKSRISRSPSCVLSRKWERFEEQHFVTVSGSEQSVYASSRRVVIAGRARARKKRWKQRRSAEKKKASKRPRGRRRKTNKEEGDAVANGHRMWSNLRGMRTGRTAREEELETR